MLQMILKLNLELRLINRCVLMCCNYYLLNLVSCEFVLLSFMYVGQLSV